jgi:hypothetical protein
MQTMQLTHLLKMPFTPVVFFESEASISKSGTKSRSNEEKLSSTMEL